MRNILALLIAGLLLPGTSLAAKSTGNLEEVTQEGYVAAEDENELIAEADEFHHELKLKGLIIRDPAVNEYVANIYDRLIPQYAKEHDLMRFFVLKDPAANAMALANGNIYLNSGLIAMCENEAQLAAIISHEAIHVLNRHNLRSARSSRKTITTANVLDIFTLGMGVSYLGAGASLANFSRDQEEEADKDSIALMQAAGYNPKEMVTIFEIFLKQPELAAVKGSIFSSHPQFKDRVAYLEEMVAELPDEGEINHEAFQPLRAELVELNVKMRLLLRQYHMALYNLDRAEDYYQRVALIDYYRGEAYRGMADHPRNAAQEESVIQTGKSSSKFLEEFTEAVPENYKKAIDAYNAALEQNPELWQAHRGLGHLYVAKNQPAIAEQHFQTYLDQPEKPRDYRYIAHLMSKLQQEEAAQ